MSGRPYLHLRKDLRDAVVAPVWPVGTRPAPFDPDFHAVQAHALLQHAYRSGGGRVDHFETWWSALRCDPDYDPGAFFLVVDEDAHIVGLAQCWSSAFVKDLVVSETWRRRGIGEALLSHVFGHFRRQGAPHVDLKVENDNPSGAERLYRRVGMRPVD